MKPGNIVWGGGKCKGKYCSKREKIYRKMLVEAEENMLGEC